MNVTKSFYKEFLQRIFTKIGLIEQPVGFPNGHYYSPVVNIKEVLSKREHIWKNDTTDGIVGIDLNLETQKSLIQSFENFYSELPFEAEQTTGKRYYFENPFYSYCDGINLYSIMRHYKPTQIIEVGSGFSSALMLDTNQLFFNNQIKLTFIEPYTERLESLLTADDKKQTTIIKTPVQDVAIETFTQLVANDILFIDSTHVSKTGSDVNYLFFEILPRLNPGVIVHIHDVYYPFEYSDDMIAKGISWNEDYLLRAYLTHNHKTEIILFADYIHKHHKESYKNLPLVYKNSGANIWLRVKG